MWFNLTSSWGSLVVSTDTSICDIVWHLRGAVQWHALILVYVILFFFIKLYVTCISLQIVPSTIISTWSGVHDVIINDRSYGHDDPWPYLMTHSLCICDSSFCPIICLCYYCLSCSINIVLFLWIMLSLPPSLVCIDINLILYCNKHIYWLC